MAGEQLRVTEGKARGERLDGGDGRADRPGRGRSRGQARRRPRALAPPRACLARRGRRADDRGPRVGQRDVRQRRADRGSRTLHVGDVVRMGQTLLAVTDASGRSPAPTQLGAHPAAGRGGAGAGCGSRSARTRAEGRVIAPGGRVHDRPCRQRGGEARRRPRAVAPSRAHRARRRRRAGHRGPRLGQRDVRQRGARIAGRTS